MSVAKKQLNTFFETHPKYATHYLLGVVFNDSDNYHSKTIVTNFEGMLSRAVETYILQNDPDNLSSMVCSDCNQILIEMVNICRFADPEMLNRIIFGWDVAGFNYLENIQRSFITDEKDLLWWEKEIKESLDDRAFNKLSIEEQERILDKEKYKREEVW